MEPLFWIAMGIGLTLLILHGAYQEGYKTGLAQSFNAGKVEGMRVGEVTAAAQIEARLKLSNTIYYGGKEITSGHVYHEILVMTRTIILTNHDENT